jgi:hypothetical protein
MRKIFSIWTLLFAIIFNGFAAGTVDKVGRFDSIQLGSNSFFLEACLAVSTANVSSLSGAITVDDVVIPNNGRLLLTAQSTASQNGPWIVNTSSAWTRPSTYASGQSIPPSVWCNIAGGGTTYGGTCWQLIASSAITVDTTATTWNQVFPKYSGGAISLLTLNVGTINFTNPPTLPAYATASLPAASAGALAWDTDALTPEGSGGVEVYYDGSAWRSTSTKIQATTSPEQFLLNCLAVGWEGKRAQTWSRVCNFFMGGTANPVGDNYWLVIGNSPATLNYQSPEAPGAIGLTTSTSSSGACSLAGPVIWLASGAAHFLISVNGALNNGLTDGTDNYIAFIGIDAASSGNPGANCGGLLYDKQNTLGFGLSATNDWNLITRTNSSITITDTGVAASTSWADYRVAINTTNLIAVINGTPVATNSANLPLGAMFPTIRVIKSAGTNARWLAVHRIFAGYRYASPQTLQ